MKSRLILALIVSLLPVAATSQTSPADGIVVEMNQAFRQGNKDRLTKLLPLARGHALEPWAAYWELKARLDTATPEEVQAFFARWPGTYQEDRLRAEWLMQLGQRRDWAAFAAEYPSYRMRDDREVRCYALLVQQVLGTAFPATPVNPVVPAAGAASAPAVPLKERIGLLPADEVKRLWFEQRDASDACSQAAARFVAAAPGAETGAPGGGAPSQASARLAPIDVWRKARLAMDANRPRAAQQAVEIVAPELSAQVGEINASPIRWLTSRVMVATRGKKELVTLALVKMASSDADGAALQLDSKWGPMLSAEERNWIWGAIGKQAAQKLSPDALDHFARVTRDTDLTDEMLAWKARAALRAPRGTQWKAVASAIDAMGETERRDSTWTYWRARAHAATGGDDGRAKALSMYEAIASPRGFYEQLASEELGRKIALPAKPGPVTAAEKEAARLNPGLNRALYMIALGLRPEGVREWNYSTNLAQPGGMLDRELLAAAQFACDREVWDRCVNTSERTKAEFDVDQRFPMPFRDVVTRKSREIGLDPAYVYGLIRQESRFIMDARSSVGASGLMQVMPATARWTAKRIGLTGFDVSQLNDRETNVAIGTAYLKLVLDDFGGSMPLAAAAYNAGPGRPRAWRNGPTIEAAMWAENVPFSETRDYVKKVLSNTTVYAAAITGQPQSLKARLPAVGPREGAAPEPNKDLP